MFVSACYYPPFFVSTLHWYLGFLLFFFVVVSTFPVVPRFLAVSIKEQD
jgi:hypothetical protein